MTDRSDHIPLPGSSRPRQRDAERGSATAPHERMEVTVTLAGPDLPEPAPGELLSRDQLASRHGADPETIRKVSERLTSFGLTVEDASPLTRSMRVSGTVAQIEAAFRPGLATYRSAEQGEFRGREGELQIPADLEGLVTGVFGLDQRRVARRRARESTIALTRPVSPAQLASHYSFPSANGDGQTVAIAEFGGGYFASDLSAFCAKHGIAVPSVTPVSVNGTQVMTLAQIQQLPEREREEQLQESVEVNMDVQIVAGLAPGAAIPIYFTSFDEQGWIELLNQLIEGKPASAVALSISWGLAEDDPDWSAGALQAIDERLQAAAAIGITVCVAAGDDGSADGLADGRAHVDFPASSPHVLAVGGTMLHEGTDVAWWQSPGERTEQGGGATGGGVSSIFARPGWQDVNVASVNQGAIAGRVVPDVAALAGPPLYDLIFLGKDSPNGGTSASAPAWAALIALMAGAPQDPWKPSFLSPLLYSQSPSGKQVGAAGCTDVTSGENTSSALGKGYQAGPGFDAVSGWGVPDGAALLAALRG